MTMITSPTTRAADNPAGQVYPAKTPAYPRLAGKSVGMVTFSAYPFDPRPRRAIDALVGAGASVDLICLGDEKAPSREVRNGIRVLRIPLKHPRRGKVEYALRYGGFIAVSSVVFALRSLRRRYDLVYVHNMPDILVLSALVPKILGAKVVLDLHDPMPELMKTIFNVSDENQSVLWMKRLEKWSIARADLVVTVNIACQRIFSSRSCRAEKIAVVMNAPDGQIFPFREAGDQKASARSSTKPFIIMYHGSLVERNGLDVAIDALARVRQTIPNAELHVFGRSTAFLERMKEFATEKGVQDAVRYQGPRNLEQLVTEIGKCDIGVIPNHRNAFTDINTPTRMFEYLALGKPVIAPSTLGITDYFDKDSLLFFEAGDAADLARQIEFAYFHPGEVLEVARRGQAVYREHTWDRERQTLLDRISGILN
jgi:glycosyltransferase involved in cell wall biosynthesis